MRVKKIGEQRDPAAKYRSINYGYKSNIPKIYCVCLPTGWDVHTESYSDWKPDRRTGT